MTDILFSVVKFIFWNRKSFSGKYSPSVRYFDTLNMEENWKILMSEICANKTAKYLSKIYEKRQSIMYQ